MHLSYCDGSIQGKRPYQEDTILNQLLPDGYFFCVLADGMGGQVGGRIASETICEAFSSYFSHKKRIEDPASELYLALMTANELFKEKIAKDNELHGMGSTVIALLIHEQTGRYSFLSVGDSPLYTYRGGGLFRLNANHSRYEDLKRLAAEGYLSPAEVKVHRERHMLTSAVTGEEIVLIDQRDGVLLAGEYLLLASDGVQILDDSVDGVLSDIITNSHGDTEYIINEALSEIINIDYHEQDNSTLIVINFAENGDGIEEEIKPPTLTQHQGGTRRIKNRSPLVPILLFLVIILFILVLALVFVKSENNGPREIIDTSSLNGEIAPFASLSKEP